MSSLGRVLGVEISIEPGAAVDRLGLLELAVPLATLHSLGVVAGLAGDVVDQTVLEEEAVRECQGYNTGRTDDTGLQGRDSSGPVNCLVQFSLV